jgi:hypothetical protein
MSSLSHLYETDFSLWLEKTAHLLREKNFQQLDIENLLEEIEGMSRSEKDALESNLIIVLQHLLKWDYQISKRSPSWSYSIYEHSRRLKKSLKNSPSLKNYLHDIFTESYQEARKLASLETSLTLDTFPLECPYIPEDILNINSDSYRL